MGYNQVVEISSFPKESEEESEGEGEGEERVEIVNFPLAHEKDYQGAVEKYGVSYQQVYSWVRKFEKEGSHGLLDRRGKGLEYYFKTKQLY